MFVSVFCFLSGSIGVMFWRHSDDRHQHPHDYSVRQWRGVKINSLNFVQIFFFILASVYAVCVLPVGGVRERSGRSVQPYWAYSQPPRRLLLQPHCVPAGDAVFLHDKCWHGARGASQLPVSISKMTTSSYEWYLYLNIMVILYICLYVSNLE